MSKKVWDVIIVGGGPAGITAALRLAREELDVVVIEAAVYPGAENWSGAVYFAERLADPGVLGPEELERAPFERRVVKRGFFTCNGPSLAGAEYRNLETFRHCYTVLRPVYDRYLAELARQRGVAFLNETTVDGLIRYADRVVGVHTDRGPLYGEIVFLAEGDASHLVSKEGFERDAVRRKKSGQPAFLQGVKEVVEIGADAIESRFGVGPGEAACYEVLLRNGTLDGKPLRLNMAGFLYTNRTSVSVGLVLPLENLARFRGDYNTLMEWFKGLPPIRRLLEGGESTSYGAKIIRGGGVTELPNLVSDGVAVGGAATGIGVDFPYPNFTGPACAMGSLFADAALSLLAEGEEPSRERLEERYVRPLRATHYYRDVEHLRNWPAFIEHGSALFGPQIDLLNGSLYALTRPDLGFARKWSETIRIVGTTLEGRWSATLSDLGRGSRALGIGRLAAKHALPALLLSVPNTLLAILPFTWGRQQGELAFSFWTAGEETGKLPGFKRWLGARYAAALSKAAATLYANDETPLRRKLDRCVGLVLRRFSLWEAVGAIVGLLGFAATRTLQRLTAARAASAHPSATRFYERWSSTWRELVDLSESRAAAAKSHDAKLGEISYSDEAGAHIKVFFPPERRGKLEDPASSSLWSVCPAAVYQINVDRTGHPSVAVNFENCVKCETCWRIEPQHVDWTRFGRHRLVYEVYTEADEALAALIARRSAQPTRVIEADLWRATLSPHWLHETDRDGADDIAPAVRAAREAIERAQAKCDELHRNLWHGPRVLEPGQVAWYGAAIRDFAYLAKRAARSALSPLLEGWMFDHQLHQALAEFQQVRRDLLAVIGRIYEQTAARRFFAAEADARQISNHHLEGLRACIDHIGDACGLTADYSSAVDAIRALESPLPARAAARASIRERLTDVFDRAVVRRLEGGGGLEPAELRTLKAAARATLGAPSPEDPDFWCGLEREDVIAELARIDPSLAALVAGHAAAVEALLGAGAPESLVDPLRRAERLATVALESEAEASDSDWRGRLPFVFTAVAETFVAGAGDRLGLFRRDADGVQVEPTPAIGLTGARVAELRLEGARPDWQGTWSEPERRTIFAARARDVTALALGASDLVAERAIDHARSRIQFPDMFQDIDGRDAVGKFGAVRAHIAHIEAGRLAIETLLQDTNWNGADDLEPLAAKAAVTDIFGPDLPSIAYRAGQVIGGSAFSEEDVFSKIYRDSSVFPHFLANNVALYIAIGERLTAKRDGPPVAAISSELDEALVAFNDRPLLSPELKRLRSAEGRLAAAAREAADRASDAIGREIVRDICGKIAADLYVWGRLLARVGRRLDGALPAERHFEAAQLWADAVEERLIGLADELGSAEVRASLGGCAFQLGDYPDTPIATSVPDFDYQRQIIEGERAYRSGDFLLEPLDLDESRYLPELVWADPVVCSHYEEYLRLFRERFAQGHYEPSFERFVERRHSIPREDIDWTQQQGFFRVVIPQEYGGQGRSKADYYSLCQISKRLADLSHTLTIQANTSIGTTPILLGLEEVDRSERELQQLLQDPDAIARIESEIRSLLDSMSTASDDQLKGAFGALNDRVGSKLGRSRILKKVIFKKFLSQLNRAGAAGLKGDQAGFAKGLEAALAAFDDWQGRARAELDEMPLRRTAHEFYLRLIAARMISAFALTEPSAGSDTARVRTEARPASRRIFTDDDGVKFFYLDEAAGAGRRNVADMRRFQFDGRKIFYRYSDEAEPAEVFSQEYTYSHDEQKYRYFNIGDRRVDIHDMALIRERDGEERYEFFVLNGAKMWITNGHIAGVEAIYARTLNGLTGFMVDALTEGFLVGKDEEKTGQRGSPTNEITLTNVRIPTECIIGIEGRGQENALETLNTGRTGLCISSCAAIQHAISDAVAYLTASPHRSAGWVRDRLGRALEEMFAVESIAFNVVGRYDDKTSDALRIESSTAKLFGTDGLHRLLHHLEPLYGIDGQTQRFRIEKDRRDARVMTIYEGTNEIQQFLQLGDLLNMVGPKLDELERLRIAAAGSPFEKEAQRLSSMLASLHDRVRTTRRTFKREAFGRVLFQPIFFRLSQMMTLINVVDSVVHRGHWIVRNLTAEADADRRAWSEAAARGFVARAAREFDRLVYGFDRDFRNLEAGERPAELRLAETVLDEAAAAAPPVEATLERVPRTPIDRDLDIVVALEYAPRLAPRPRVRDGRLNEHLYSFTPGDRRALSLALALKSASPERVTLTLVCAAPLAAEERLRLGLAAGADRGLLIDTGPTVYTEHSLACAVAAALQQHDIQFDLLLSNDGDPSPGGGLGTPLAATLGLDSVPAVTDVWVAKDGWTFASERFPETNVNLPGPIVARVSDGDGEPDWEFSSAGYVEALRKPLELLPFPGAAEPKDEEYSTAAVPSTSDADEEAGRIDPERAASMLLEVGNLADGTGGTGARPFQGTIGSLGPESLGWAGVAFVVELDGDEVARDARAPALAAHAIAARGSLPLDALVMSEPLDDTRRRAVSGDLLAMAPFGRVIFAEHPVLASGAPRAYAEALIGLLGSRARSRPAYLLSSAWLAEVLPIVAGDLRSAGIATEELAALGRLEFPDEKSIAFVRPIHERKLRARRRRSLEADEVRLIWCEPEVAVEAVEGAAVEPAVFVTRLDLEFDPQTDALARALAEARKTLGVVTLENAEFVIDVGAGLGSIDNLETIVEPLRRTLLERGAANVEIGATRKVTMDMSWLPDEHQIGQTGVRVNPRVLIALGVSGAPQHVDWIGDRAVIFAFNMDPQAPLMTLNQRREQPKVYPVVGDLFQTVPKFIEALKRSSPGD